MPSSKQQPSHLRLHYTLTHRAVAAVSQWFDGYTYTVRHGPLSGMKRKGGLGFLPFGPRRTAESQFFAQLDLRNRVVYDVGGFQGLLTLFFAARAAHVVVYEPNPASRARLEENLRLNGVGNVTVRPVGVGDGRREATLTFDPLMPGAASADASIAAQIRTTAEHSATATVPIVTLDEDLAERGLPLPDFVKIDVEGLELAVLTGMRELLYAHRPTLYIEMHGATLDEKLANASRVVTLLDEIGYPLRHVESGQRVTPSVSAIAAHGHLVAAAGH